VGRCNSRWVAAEKRIHAIDRVATRIAHVNHLFTFDKTFLQRLKGAVSESKAYSVTSVTSD